MAKGWNKPRLAAGVAEGAPLGHRCHVHRFRLFCLIKESREQTRPCLTLIILKWFLYCFGDGWSFKVLIKLFLKKLNKILNLTR